MPSVPERRVIFIATPATQHTEMIMTITKHTESALANAGQRRRGRGRHHKLPVCQHTGLARYRDRHQARDAARVTTSGNCGFKVSTFGCPECRGYHLEELYPKPHLVTAAATPAAAYTDTLSGRPRRYVLFDIENVTQGAKATAREASALWDLLKRQAPGFSPRDHIVVGAGRTVAHQYRGAIHGDNVKWVIGAKAPDGADAALLNAIDLYRAARDYDELVIISGDHAFAPLAHKARSFGMRVHVISAEHTEQRTTLARDLADAADLHTTVRLNPRPARHARGLAAA